MTKKTNPRNLEELTDLDAFLDEEGIREEVTLKAIKRVIAAQLDLEMRMKRISKTELARRMNTSRAQVDSVLDPARNVTLETLSRAAKVMGRKVRLELV
jgi:antitoxin HicB